MDAGECKVNTVKLLINTRSRIDAGSPTDAGGYRLHVQINASKCQRFKSLEVGNQLQAVIDDIVQVM